MEPNILNSVKKILGIDAAYTAFDVDIFTHINSAFSTLDQLGVGPSAGFMLEDGTEVWDDFYLAEADGVNLNQVRTYVYLKVRMLFDPPSTSFLLSAMQDQIREMEWRLNVHREETYWTDPDPDEISEEEGEETLLEGGGA